MSNTTKQRRRLSRWFWSGFFFVLGLGVLMALFAAIRGGNQWVQSESEQVLPPPVAEVVRVTLAGGESIYIDADAVEPIRARSREWLAERRSRVATPLFETLDRETDAMLAAAQQQVPAFADWYFSLTGEYARLFHAATSDLPDYMASQIEALVFNPAGTADAIEALGPALDEELKVQLENTAAGLQTLLARLVREASVETKEAQIEIDADWQLGQQLAEQLAPYVKLGTSDLLRQGAAVTAGAGLSAAAAKKIGAMSVAKASAKIAAAEATGLFAVAASKLGVKALAGAGTGAASGAALCAGSVVGAPLSPGCALIGGVVSGVATWLLVDKAVLEAEEALRRDDFENELKQALATWRDDLRADYRSQYEAAAEAAMASLDRSLEQQIRPVSRGDGGTFVPAEAVGR